MSILDRCSYYREVHIKEALVSERCLFYRGSLGKVY